MKRKLTLLMVAVMMAVMMIPAAVTTGAAALPDHFINFADPSVKNNFRGEGFELVTSFEDNAMKFVAEGADSHFWYDFSDKFEASAYRFVRLCMKNTSDKTLGHIFFEVEPATDIVAGRTTYNFSASSTPMRAAAAAVHEAAVPE